MTLDEHIADAIATAKSQTNRIEQRALALLHQRGVMAGLTCGEIQDVESRVRELLLGGKEQIVWHPVAERLPDHTRNVMIYMPSDPDQAVWTGYHDKHGWQFSNGCPVDEPVTHWAEMPTGPKA